VITGCGSPAIITARAALPQLAHWRRP